MKTKTTTLICCLILLCAALPSRSLGMPALAPDTDDNETTPVPKDAASPATAQPQAGGEVAKAAPLTWPDTTIISEDTKNLLQSDNKGSDNKEIVQLFTQAQEVCKNMNDTLITLNSQRDTANKQYRDTIGELETLLQRIGAAQAAHKK